MTAGVTLVEVAVGDSAAAWTAAGFTVADGVAQIGSVGIRLLGEDGGRGIRGWTLTGIPALPGDQLDGVPTVAAPAVPSGEPVQHPNGILEIDHVVLLSPNLPRTVAALAAADLEPRRERDGQMAGTAVRQIFYRLGPTILEVVGSPETTADGPSSLWGITYVVADIDAAAAYFGPSTSPVKDAVQPGRRITTLRHRELDLSVRTALISPHPRSADAG